MLKWVLTRNFKDKESKHPVYFICKNIDLVVFRVKIDRFELAHAVLLVKVYFSRWVYVQIQAVYRIAYNKLFLSFVANEELRLSRESHRKGIYLLNNLSMKVQGENAVNFSKDNFRPRFAYFSLKMENQACLFEDFDILDYDSVYLFEIISGAIDTWNSF